jgi:hypothetical protein
MLLQVKRDLANLQGIVIYTDVVEGENYGVLSPGTPVVILSEKQTHAHCDSSPIMIDWAYVLSPKGLGWVWRMYLSEIA